MPKRWLIAALVGLLLLTAVVYAPGLHGEFQFDDLRTVQFNQGIRRLDYFTLASSLAEMLRNQRADDLFSDVGGKARAHDVERRFPGSEPWEAYALRHGSNYALRLFCDLTDRYCDL